jgi:hypothetical protein
MLLEGIVSYANHYLSISSYTAQRRRLTAAESARAVLLAGLLGLLALLGVPATGSAAAPPAAKAAPRATKADLKKASVKLAYQVAQNIYNGGSGTVIRKDADVFWVLSVAHMLSHNGKHVEKGSMFVYTHDGKRYKGILSAYKPSKDLLLIKVKAQADVTAIPLAPKTILGAKVVKYGFPDPHKKGAQRVLRIGRGRSVEFSAAHKSWQRQSVMCKIKADHGDSGGGLFSKGQLVGVLWGGDGPYAWGTTIKEIRPFLKWAEFTPGR